MFKKPGRALRLVSSLFFMVGAITSLFAGVFTAIDGDIIEGFMIIGFGVFISFVVGLILECYGKHVESIQKLAEIEEERWYLELMDNKEAQKALQIRKDKNNFFI